MRNRIISVFLLTALMVVSQPCTVNGFNANGHKVIASVCFQQLTESQQSAVLQILKKHPRFEADFADKMPPDVRNGNSAIQAEWLFQQAAIWPDLVRSGPAARTAFHRARWHYINRPHFLSVADRDELADNVDVNLLSEPPVDEFDDRTMNVLAAIQNSRRIIRNADQLDSLRAVHICWVLHCIPDLHQPLYSTALFSRHSFRQGDRGGNAVPTIPLGNLHSAWDAAIGSSDSFISCRNQATQLLSNINSAPLITGALASLDPVVWCDESFAIAVEHAYNREVLLQLTAIEESGDDIDHHPVSLSEEYLRNRRAVSDRQAIIAGVRTAKILTGLSGAGLNPFALPAELAAVRRPRVLRTEEDDVGSTERLLQLEEKIDRPTQLVERLLSRRGGEWGVG